MTGYCYGIDVSGENGRWNWEPFKDDDFAAVRCTSWDSSDTPDIDPEFGRNWERMQHYDLVRIAYHELRLDKCEPLGQAVTVTHILREHGLQPSDMIELAIDSPYTHGQSPEKFAEAASIFVHRIKRQIPNHRILVYVNVSDGNAGYAAGLANHGLHIAEYEVQHPAVPEPWKSAGQTWVFWQSSGSTPPDRDVFNGTKDDLRKFALKYA